MHSKAAGWTKPLGHCPPGTRELWHRFAVAEQVWFSLTAPIVCLGFVGCLELRQPRAGSGNVSGIRCSTPKTNPLPEGGTHPSLMYKKRHYCIVSVLSGFLALPSDSINILRISFLQPLSGSTWIFSSQVLWNVRAKTWFVFPLWMQRRTCRAMQPSTQTHLCWI